MLKMTALHWAAQHGHREVAELLLKYGADVHSLSKFDKTPFDIAMDTSNTELMILLQVKGLCVLFLYGSDHLFSQKCPYVCIRREVNTDDYYFFYLNTCKYVFLSLVYITRVEALKVKLFAQYVGGTVSVFYVCTQDGMQNQVNMNPEPQFIISSAGVVNLSDLVNTTAKSGMGNWSTGYSKLGTNLSRGTSNII
jgi:hypothetical protein